MGEAILGVLIHQNTGLSMLFFGLWLSLQWVCTERCSSVRLILTGFPVLPSCPALELTEEHIWGWVRMQEMLDKPH